VDAPERQARRARAEQLLFSLAEQAVSMVATTFVDNSGITRLKSVPLNRLPELAAWGVGASTSFDYFRFDDWLAAPPGGTAPVGDLRVIPDLRRLVALAAQPGWAWTPGDRYRQDGEPHERCSRLLLQRLVDHAAGDGLEIKAAFEIEWVVSAGDGEDFVSAAVGPAYGMSRLIAVSDYVRDLVDALSAEGITVEQFHPEYAAGQLELSVAAESPVDAADTSVLVRSTIRAVGPHYHYRTSFSPKVEAEGVGNGGHVHLSVWRDGQNLMAGGDERYGLTGVGAAFAAGILDRLPALLAIGAPSVAS
jgi:glutamine synthetase